MAERDCLVHQLQVHPQHQYEGGMKSHFQQRGPSTTKVLAVLALLLVGGTLLTLFGLTLLCSVIGLAVSTLLFIIFSPVLVPAAIVIGVVTEFLCAQAFRLTRLSSLSWVLNHIVDQAERRMKDMAGYVGQKTKEVGQEIERNAQERRT
ncbi:hypothetical protein ACB094_06G188000 [Castanea mollissima]